jgi:hypothetical protein
VRFRVGICRRYGLEIQMIFSQWRRRATSWKGPLARRLRSEGGMGGGMEKEQKKRSVDPLPRNKTRPIQFVELVLKLLPLFCNFYAS